MHISSGSLVIRRALKTWLKWNVSSLSGSAGSLASVDFLGLQSFFFLLLFIFFSVTRLLNCQACSLLVRARRRLALGHEWQGVGGSLGAGGNHRSWSMGVPGRSQHPLPDQLCHCYCSGENSLSHQPRELFFFFTLFHFRNAPCG